jgi:SAM-dependent methyltransferase
MDVIDNDRAIEIPWLEKQLETIEYDWCLDVGAAGAWYKIPRCLGVDVRDEEGVHFVMDAEDLRELETQYDLITCISVIEHIGLRSPGYGTEFEPGKREKVFAAMYDVLSPDGTMLVTAPFGKFETRGFLINFDASYWDAMIEEHVWASRIEEYFKWDKSEEKHFPSSREELKDVPFPPGRVYRSAGIVCARLVKP